MQHLNLSANAGIRSTLPEAWAGNGTWTNLTTLDLSRIDLTGTIPAAWFANGSWSSMKLLDLSHGNLSGTLPQWSGAGRPQDMRVYLGPGNSQLCGSLPAGFPAFDSQSGLPLNGLSACPGSGAENQPSSDTAPIVGAVLAFLLLLQRSRRRNEELRKQANYPEGILSDWANQSGTTGSYGIPLDGEGPRLSLLSLESSASSSFDKASLSAGDSFWKLGSGAFGTVYKAVLDGYEDVAVKFVPPNAMTSAEQQGINVQSEISIMRACRHHNIVGFFGAWLDESKVYCVMELMEHGDLTSKLAEGSDYNWYGKGASIALDVAKGGTWSWLAPELAMGIQCSTKADIWSFGMEIVTSELPHRGANRDVRVPEECPLEVAQLIKACTETEPELRPSAPDIVRALQRITAFPDMPPETPTSPYASPPLRSHPSQGF
ncbi:hypothetical protein WJX73_003661 [Symbiochloris irregularis]|uniref:Protein kinase domain-containing protein n=1 Tax=Symbiochloris irregularis TaxID=706552 RepID=A0AAW1NMK8_9CHLO